MDAIKYSKLIDVGHFYGGLSGKSKEDFEDGNAKFITYMNVFSNPSLKTNVDDKVRIEEGEKQNVVEYGDVLFTGSSETPDECGMSSVLEEHTDEPLYLNSFCFGFRFNDVQTVVPAFFKHLFRSNSIRARIAKTANGVTRFNVSKKLFGEIEIPIPPITMQEKIANQLNVFSSVIVNLENELASRQKQYDYYLNKLLTFNKNIESCDWKTLGVIGEMFERYCPSGVEYVKIKDIYARLKGTPITAGIMKEIEDPNGDITIYAGGRNIISAFEKDIPNANIISCPSVIVQSRGIIDAQYCESPFTFKNEMWAYTNDNQSTVKFLYYYLKENIGVLRQKGSEHGSMPQISLGATEDMEIPNLPVPIQQEIVCKLDSFQTLIANIKQELEARKKQYEYYREQLLTFE